MLDVSELGSMSGQMQMQAEWYGTPYHHTACYTIRGQFNQGVFEIDQGAFWTIFRAETMSLLPFIIIYCHNGLISWSMTKYYYLC